jgi:hypothetical protein
MSGDNVHKFGMGSCMITDEQELSILVSLGWDGTTAPYPLIRQWLTDRVHGALLTVELEQGKLVTDDIRDAFEKCEWARDKTPEKEFA